MANKRMFSLSVVDTDRFIEMPVAARLLYYELGMRADDDGFVGAPNKILRMLGFSRDDLQALLDNGYITRFDSGVVAVTHWRVNNSIKKDRYTPTVYTEEKEQLTENNKIYAGKEQERMSPVPEPQDRIEKDRIVEDREEKESGLAAAAVSSFHHFCPQMPAVTLSATRDALIAKAAVCLRGVGFAAYFRRVSASDFLTGRNGKWQGCSFDWLLRPEVIGRVLDGAYDNNSAPARRPSGSRSSYDIEALEQIDTLDFVN